MRHDCIFLIVGKSGVGKTYLCDRLEDRTQLSQIRSYTTRPKRGDDDNSHTFVESFKEWFLQSDEHETIVGETSFDGHEYWATSKQIEEHDLYVIDIDGIEYFKKHYCGRKTPYIIYLHENALERFFRMIDRGDSVKNAIKRLFHDFFAFRGAKKYADLVVRNKDFEECYRDVYWFILDKMGDT